MFKFENRLNLTGTINSLPDYYNPPNFIPFNSLTHRSNKFADFDSPDRFNTILKKMSKNWHYKNKKITYDVNKNGYRAPEWEDVDWENSVVILGCSNVMGIGVAEDETVSSQLSQLIGKPVINLGVPGSAIDHSFYNTTILAEYYPTPYAVVNIWTTLDRCSYFNPKNLIKCGPWTPNHPFYKEFSKDDYHAIVTAKMISSACKLIWKNTRYYESSYFDRTAHYLNCAYVHIDNQARDLVHPGRNSNFEMATLISNNIS
jgi:hypothetical protein